jgi:hypothetical protein
MPQVGFEPTIPVFKRAKTLHALDRAATVIGALYIYIYTCYKYEHVLCKQKHHLRINNGQCVQRSGENQTTFCRCYETGRGMKSGRINERGELRIRERGKKIKVQKKSRTEARKLN